MERFRTSIFNLAVGIFSLSAINLLPLWATLAFIVLALIIGFSELYTLAKSSNIKINFYIGFFLTIMIVLFFAIAKIETKVPLQTYHNNTDIIAITIMVLLLYGLSGKNPKETFIEIASTLAFCLYIGILGSYLIKILFLPIGRIHLSYLVTAVWLRDTGTYFLGPYIKDKLVISPNINPKKTYGGALAGWLFMFAIVMLFNELFSIFSTTWKMPLWYILGVTVIAGFFGQAGDLIESFLKRISGEAHTFSTLPLSQGVLDKIDGILYTAPVLYVFLIYSCKYL